jgi:hypothetical protein
MRPSYSNKIIDQIQDSKNMDIFDNKIICNKCNDTMNKSEISKNGFILRVMVCPNCGQKIIHPGDEQEYNRFVDLKNRDFRVKMRLVGNSYAVSIPKEIVSFMQEQEKQMNEMVKLCFEDFGKLSLNFNQDKIKQDDSRIIRTREYRVVKDNKPVLHVRQFSDSANPKNNKQFLIKKTDKTNKNE